jgi:hypothetical protein
MTDDVNVDLITGPYTGPSSIPQADVLRFIENKLPNFRCTMCDHESFEVFTIQNAHATIMVEKSSWRIDNRTGTFSVPVINMSCNNCGFLYKFAAALILEWIASNPVAT